MNVLPLGSYDVFIGMDWLEAHKVKFDCYNKTFECMGEEGNPVVVKGNSKGNIGKEDFKNTVKEVL